MNNTDVKSYIDSIRKPPTGLAILALVGPSFVWCAEYIGSGEVILATRTGSILGHYIIWSVVLGIFLKYWIGMSGARYTVCTGEGMIDMFSRIPGPRNWVVWVVLVVQFISATISIGSIASAAGVFIATIIPISPYLGGWIITLVCLIVVWSGGFKVLQVVMSIFVMVIVIGVVYVALRVIPEFSELVKGMLGNVPQVPQWALSYKGVSSNPWREILPLLGWGAGGFASQVWYTYWVLGAGYGMAEGKGYGKPADVNLLRKITVEGAKKIKGWCKVVYIDATIAFIIGCTVTISFLLAGAGILRPLHLAPEGTKVAITLSIIFSEKWGEIGGLFFMLSASLALISTLMGILAGWPRLLADSFRICFPAFQRKFQWKTQFRIFLLFFLCTNMIIVYSFGLEPVVLVKLGAILDGLLLTPLQAIWIAVGLFIVLPRLYSKEAGKIVKPHWIFAVGLLIASIVFGYFCIFQIPYIL